MEDNIIEFDTALNDLDFKRALEYLERGAEDLKSRKMWRTLATRAVENDDLVTAESAYGRLGDVARLNEVRGIQELAVRVAGSWATGAELPEVKARIALLRDDLTTAEDILVSGGLAAQAVDMYRTLNMWPDAIRVASLTQSADVRLLSEEHKHWLLESQREHTLAGLCEQRGQLELAVKVLQGSRYQLFSAVFLIRNPRIVTEIWHQKW